MRQLTTKEVAAVRDKMVEAQGGRCPICGLKITGVVRGGAVLDHDHATGVVRSALCRVCNGGEGKIRNAAMRYGGGATQALSWLKRLVAYLEYHSTARTELLYPKKKATRSANAKAKKPVQRP